MANLHHFVVLSLFTYAINIVSCMNGRLTHLLKERGLKALACQGEQTNIMCNDYEGIRVSDAFWGRDNKIDCQSDDPLSYLTHRDTCSPLDKDYAFRKVAELCQNKQHCNIAGTPLFFDTELCPHVRKFVRIDYECREMSGMRKSDVEKAERKSLIDASKRSRNHTIGNATKISHSPKVLKSHKKKQHYIKLPSNFDKKLKQNSKNLTSTKIRKSASKKLQRKKNSKKHNKLVKTKHLF